MLMKMNNANKGQMYRTCLQMWHSENTSPMQYSGQKHTTWTIYVEDIRQMQNEQCSTTKQKMLYTTKMSMS